MRWSIIRLITMRETRDLLRDRRTVLLILVMPAILYPFFGLAGFLLAKSITDQKTIVGIVGGNTLSAGKEVNPLLLGDQFVDASTDTDAAAGSIVGIELDGDPATALREKRVDVVLIIPAGFSEQLKAGNRVKLKIENRDGDEKSKLATKRLTEIVRRWEGKLREARFVRAGLSKEFDRVLDIDEPQASKPKAKRAADELRDQFVRIFPFVLMMWIVAGSIQPAVDLTAGEKERGTMETLLISPAERNEIVFGKFLAVAFFSFGSVIWNVLWLAGGALIVELLLGFPILNWPGLIGCIIVGFPLAMFFSAICVALGVFARSTKEGQYYLMPLILIAMPLAFSTMLPGTELNFGNSLVPITGALLLQQKLLSISSDPTPWGFFFSVIGGLAVCVTAALWFAVRQFKRESVLFRETGAGQGGSLRKFFGG